MHSEVSFLLMSFCAVPRRSLAEFWNDRWNRPTHWLLYSLFFAPLARRGFPKVGLVLSFSYSALLHWYPTFLAGVGSQMALGMGMFFLLHALLLSVERLLRLPSPWNYWYTWGCAFATMPLIIEPAAAMMGY